MRSPGYSACLGGGQIGRNTLYCYIMRIAVKLGLENVTVKKFRSTFATAIFDQGKLSVPDAMALLGHEDYETTKKYVLAAGSKLHREVEQLDLVPYSITRQRGRRRAAGGAA